MASIRWVRPDLTMSANSCALASSAVAEVVQRREQIGADAFDRRDMDGAGDDVVGGLAIVDLIVGMNSSSNCGRR